MKTILITIVAVLLVGCGEPLYEASKEGKTDEVKKLLAEGANINSTTDYYSETPLHFAAENGQTEVVQLLIDKGADLNAKAKWERTPLHGAAKTGNAEIVKF